MTLNFHNWAELNTNKLKKIHQLCDSDEYIREKLKSYQLTHNQFFGMMVRHIQAILMFL